MINNTSRQRRQRLSRKTLDHQFLNEMIEGLRCSPFEAKAILEKVHEVFEPWFAQGRTLRPGQVQLNVVDLSVAPNVPLERARQRLVTLTLYDPPAEQKEQPTASVGERRRQRLARMAEEAFQQGGLLTLEDVAALLNCGLRTLVRDLEKLRAEGVTLPLRSTIKDMGRAITHRRQIVELWLQGHEYSTIARKSRHSVDSVANYVEKFKRCVAAFQQTFDLNTTAFLVNLSLPLATAFHGLYCELKPVAHRRAEMDEYAQKTPSV
jgi:hypothetical protein